MRIRTARTQDLRPLLELVRQFPTPTPPDAATYERTFHAKIQDPASRVAVIEKDGSLCGYISGSRYSAFYANGDTAWVDEILVTEACRAQGMGRLLMQDFESWARGSGCVLVGLATAGARSFYEHLGYGSKAGYFKKYIPRDA
jgi:GNAT superfamily N-acetyltransferase